MANFWVCPVFFAPDFILPFEFLPNQVEPTINIKVQAFKRILKRILILELVMPQELL